MIASIYIIFSALMGSFLASFIYRYVNRNIEADAYVQSINIYKEPSFCPTCKTKIDWYHLIPVLSYLFLKGKAKCCGATISSRYFFTEFLVITLFLLIFVSNDNFSLIFLKSLITLNLIFIALIDHKHKVIPLSSLLFLTVFAIVLSQQTNILNLSELFVTLISGLILLSLRWFYLKFKNREGLGLGDVILFPILTLMVPMNTVPILLLTASLLGIVEFLVSTKLKKDSEIAFGSHLSIAGYLGLINFYPILQINFF